MKKIEDDDFGFSSVDEADILEAAPGKNKAELMYKLVSPFFLKMRDSGDKDYIKWPADKRKEQCEKIIKQLEEILG